MGLATRRRTRIVIVALALLGVAAAVDGTRLWKLHVWNRTIAEGPLPDTTKVDARSLPLEVRFALAAAQAASGADEPALDAYRALQGDTPLGQAARYNGANALLRQAIKVRATNQPGQAIPLIELAKETYREVLRAEPQRWIARYNLERAQRLLPDAEEGDAASGESPQNAERAATTMRGVSPGLP